MDQNCENHPLLMSTSHEHRAVTDKPIMGVLVQPFEIVKQNLINFQNNKATSFLPSSHVKFLESAGARIIPIDYSLPFT